MNKLNKCVDWKDILLRAVKTFIQSFVAVLSIEGVITLENFNGLKTALLSASVASLSAVLSAIMNVCSCLMKQNEEKNKKGLSQSDTEKNKSV